MSGTAEILSKEDCLIIIKNKIRSTNYEFVSFEVTPLTNVSGFLGVYHRLQIKIRWQNQDKIFKFFIKCAPKAGIHYEITRDVQPFKREVFVYHEIVGQMHNFGIKTIDECIAKSYFHKTDNLIVFEDMSLLGYRNMDAMKPLDLDSLYLVVRKLARFHACSLILEDKASFNIKERYGEYLQEPFFFVDDEHMGARQCMTGLKSILSAIEQFPQLKNGNNYDNFKKCWPQLQKLFFETVKTSDKYRNVLAHGDLWTSNLLVKFDKNNKPEDCIFLDFQIARYCPPAFDLLSVLYLTTHGTTRQENEENLVKKYYDELDYILQSYGYSAANILPFEELIASMDYIRPQMIIHTAIECMLTMCTPGEVSSFVNNEEKCRYVFFEDREEFVKAMLQKSELYRKRLTECLLEIYEYCNKLVEK